MSPTLALTVQDPSDALDLAKVDEFLAGSLDAFEWLFEKYREKVFRIAFRYVRNTEDALEITQEVFLRVYRGLASFKTDSKFFTWLYRIAVNKAIDHTRRRKTRAHRQLEPSALEAQRAMPGRSEPRDPAETVADAEMQERLLGALDDLSEKHRSVFLLHAMENLSYKEIAGVMQCSIGTVMSRLFYARKKLQEMLGKVGLETPSRRRKEMDP